MSKTARSASQRLLRRGVTVCLLIASTTVVITSKCGTATGQSLQRPAGLQYRLIYAPLDVILQKVKGHGEYPRMSLQEFQDLTDTSVLPDSVVQQAVMEQAVYTGRLENRELLSGTARWQVKQMTPDITWLNLNRAQLALSDIRWLRSNATLQDADIGTFADRNIMLRLSESGTLQARWTLAASYRDEDDIIFDLQLPACPINRLDLQVPADLELTTSDGVARRVVLDEDPAAAASGPSAVTDVDVWNLDLGGQNECQLRLRRKSAPSPRIGLRQSNRYTVAEDGVDLVTNLALDCVEQSIHHLQVELDPALQITQVSHDGRPIPWSAHTTSQSNGRATLQFKPPLEGLNRQLRINAVAPPPLANEDWQVPEIRVINVDWQQETASIRVQAPLEVRDLQFQRALQITPNQLGALGNPAPVAVRYLSSAHEVRMRLAETPVSFTSQSATRIVTDDSGMQATIELNLRSLSRDLFDVSMQLGSDWEVESIDATDEDLDLDWIVENRADRARALNIRFFRPLERDQWSRFTIRTRRSFQFGTESLQALRPLTIPDLNDHSRHFIAIQSNPVVSAVFPNDEQVTWLHLDDLDAEEAELVMDWGEDRLILLQGVLDRQYVTFQEPQQRPGNFSANIGISTLFEDDTVQETLRLELTRQGGTVPPLRIRCSQPRSTPLRWLSESPTGAQREITAEKMATSADFNGEIWQVSWPDETEERVTIIGQRAWPMSDSETITLATVDDASPQDGSITLQTAPQLQLDVQPSRLFTLLPESQPSYREISRRQSVYRFAPRANIFAEDSQMRVDIRTATETDSNWLTVWRMSTETYLDPVGIARDEVTLWIENQGATQLTMRFPNNSQIREVSVNGEQLSLQADENRSIQIPLRESERFPFVRVRYDRKIAPLGIWHSVPRVFPTVEAQAIMHDEWTVWTPPSHAMLPAGPRRFSSRTNGLSLRSWATSFMRQIFTPIPRQTTLGRGTSLLLIEIGRAQDSPLGHSFAKLGSSVWVDERQLSQQGITPETTLPAVKSLGTVPDVEWGKRCLKQARLAVVELDNAVVITTDSQLSKIESATQRPLNSNCYLATGAKLVNGRIQGLPPLRDLELARISDWRVLPSIWRETAKASIPIASGWQSQEIVVGNKATVFHKTTLHAFGYALSFLAAAVVWLVGNRYGYRRAVLAWACLTAISVLVASPMQSWGWHLLIGSLIGVCLPLMVSQRPPSNQSETDTVSSAAAWSPQMTSIWVALAIWITSSTGTAQIVDERPPPIAEVFISIDEQQRPTGDVFVPRSFQNQLRKSRPLEGGLTPAWVLANANYRGVLEASSDQSGLELRTITADFELVVSAVETPIQFPLSPAAAAAIRGEAFFDGRRVNLNWTRDRSAIVIPVFQTGRHQLQLSFYTQTNVQGSQAIVELPIPIAPAARLVLTSPQATQSLTVPSAIGATQRREASNQLEADLGPTDRLEIRWPRSSTPDSVSAVDQLSWLRLGRDAVKLEIQLIVDTSKYLEPALVALVDERLQLNVVNSTPPLSWVPDDDVPGTRRMEFSVDSVKNQQTTIQLSFNVTGSSGIGYVPLPRFQVVGQRNASWLAVSADPTLVLRVEPGNGETLNTNEFAAGWGGDETPDYAYRFSGDVRGWVCQGQRSLMTSQVNQEFCFVAMEDGTQTLMTADVGDYQATTFLQKLHVPEDFRVKSAELLTDGSSRRLRWSRSGLTEVTLFFPDPVSGPYRLGIIGHQTQALGNRKLPKITFANANHYVRHLDIYRGPNVLLADTSELGQTPEISSFARSHLPLARWQLRRQTPTQADDWWLNVLPNERELNAELASLVRRENGGWMHYLDVNLQMNRGVQDSLTFEMPDNWRPLMRADGYRLMFAQSPRPETVRVTIWPQDRSFADDDQVSFQGEIPNLRDGRLSVPNIRLLEKGQVDRLVYLPDQIEGQPVVWSTPGLTPLDKNEPLPEIPDAQYRGYRVTADQFRATRLPAKMAVGNPTVTLADIHVAHRKNQPYQGLALFDLSPDGLEQCVLELPVEIVPVAVTVDEHPVALDAINESESSQKRRWQLRLSSNELPQRVAVTFTGDHSTTAPGTLWAPQLRVPDNSSLLPVDQTLWTTYQLGDSRLQLFNASSKATNEAKIRLDNLQQVFAQASNVATDFPADAMRRWYAIWGERFVTAVRRSTSSENPDHPAHGESEMTAGDELPPQQAHAEWVAQMRFDDMHQQIVADADAMDALEIWRQALPPTRQTISAIYQGATPNVRVNNLPDNTPSWSRFGIAVIVLLFGVLVQGIPRRRRSDSTAEPMKP